MAQPRRVDFDKFNDSLNNCLQSTQKIRDVISTSQPFIEVAGDPVRNQFVIKHLEEQINSLNTFYDTIEKAARELPDATKKEAETNIPLSVFQKFVAESFADEKSDRFYNGAIDEAKYMEYLSSYAKHVSELLPTMGQKFKSVYDPEIDLPNTDYSTDNLQKRFERIFIECIREANKKAAQQKSYKIIEKFLERGTLKAIIDIQIISKCEIRALLVVSLGQVEYINIYPSTEILQYFDAKRKIIDAYASSKSEMYKILTQMINTQLQIFYQGQQKRTNDVNTSISLVINYIINLLLKMSHATASKCKVCDKYLKNDLPPLQIDFRHKAFVHPECRT